MDILKLSRSQAVTTRWSGGTTTEFYIDPPGSAYARRDFAVRISSATVDLEASDFTLLPDYNRIILPLKGGFTLTFPEDGNRQVTLGPLEQASFDGAWHTHSVGKAVDFNVMTRKGLSASCEKIAGSRPAPPCSPAFRLRSLLDGSPAERRHSGREAPGSGHPVCPAPGRDR